MDLATAYNFTTKLDLHPSAPLWHTTKIKRGGTLRGTLWETSSQFMAFIVHIRFHAYLLGICRISVNETKVFIMIERKTKRLTNTAWSINCSKVSTHYLFEAACKSSRGISNASVTRIGHSCQSIVDNGSPPCVVCTLHHLFFIHPFVASNPY